MGVPLRALFSLVPGFGHFHPLVPLARALVVAGHEVAFSTVERFGRRVIEPAGFTNLAAGMSPLQVDEEMNRRPGVAALDPEDVWAFGAHLFAGVAGPAKVADLVGAIERWRPDVVVHDPVDFAAPVAAAHAGLPWAAHSFGGLQPLAFWEPAAELMVPTWEAWGVEPGSLGGMFRWLYLDVCPPSLQDTDVDVPVSRPLRPVPFDATHATTLPGWVKGLAPVPTVYVTLGTLFNHRPVLFESLLEGLGSEPLNVVVTVGPDRNPAELGPQPDNVHVESYVPQSLLFGCCHAVVSHGGSGTTLAALAHGLPHLLVPLGANQFWNARRCVALGAGRTLTEAEATPEAIRRELWALLDRPEHRAAAERLRDEIAAMPGPEAGVGLLERLVVEGRTPL